MRRTWPELAERRLVHETIRRMINEMIGELNASHTGAAPGGTR